MALGSPLKKFIMMSTQNIGRASGRINAIKELIICILLTTRYVGMSPPLNTIVTRKNQV